MKASIVASKDFNLSKHRFFHTIRNCCDVTKQHPFPRQSTVYPTRFATYSINPRLMILPITSRMNGRYLLQ